MAESNRTMPLVQFSLRTMLCASLIAIASPCGAQSFAQVDRAVKPVTATGGIIFSNGGILVGENFTVKHKVTGEYVVTFAKGLFALNPVFTCGVFGSGSPPAPPGCINYTSHWVDAVHGTTATFHTYDAGTGEPVDASFTFTAIAVKSSVSH